MSLSINDKILNSNNFKFLNFICTSRSDYHDLEEKKWIAARVWNCIYLAIIFLTLTGSFTPLFFISVNVNEKEILKSWWMILLNSIVFGILFIDYVFRWITYPIRVERDSLNPLFFFIFTSTNLIMLLSLSSSFLFLLVSILPDSETLTKTAKLFSAFKIFRFILLLNIIPSFKILTEIFVKNKIIILTLLFAVISMVLIMALIIYSVEYMENNLINNYFDALYYSFITVATVGFGDIVCITKEGRIISIILGITGSVAFAIPFAAVIATFTAKIQEKYRNSYENNKIYNACFIEKVFLKYYRKRKNIGEVKTKIVLKKFDKEKDLMVFNRFIELLGGQENVDNIITYDSNVEITLFESNKINSEFKVLAGILKIHYSIEKK